MLRQGGQVTIDKESRDPSPTGVRAVFSCLENVFRQVLQGSLPIYRTIPVPILHWEAAIPLLEHIFDHRWALAHLQAACLDNCHPVRRRLCKPQLTISCLHLHSLHPSCLEGLEQVSPILLPPWQPGTLISNKHGQNLPQPPDYLPPGVQVFQTWAANWALSLCCCTQMAARTSRGPQGLAGFAPDTQKQWESPRATFTSKVIRSLMLRQQAPWLGYKLPSPSSKQPIDPTSMCY